MNEQKRTIAQALLLAPFFGFLCVCLLAWADGQMAVQKRAKQGVVKVSEKSFNAEAAALRQELKALCVQLKKDLPIIKRKWKSAPEEGADSAR